MTRIPFALLALLLLPATAHAQGVVTSADPRATLAPLHRFGHDAQ